MKKILLIATLAATLGGCDDPAFTKAVNECADKLKEAGPIMKMITNDPYGHCREQLKPYWELGKIIVEQKEFEAKRPKK
jgi:hypothetical protein